jgi:hypothetical protein
MTPSDGPGETRGRRQVGGSATLAVVCLFLFDVATIGVLTSAGYATVGDQVSTGDLTASEPPASTGDAPATDAFRVTRPVFLEPGWEREAPELRMNGARVVEYDLDGSIHTADGNVVTVGEIRRYRGGDGDRTEAVLVEWNRTALASDRTDPLLITDETDPDYAYPNPVYAEWVLRLDRGGTGRELRAVTETVDGGVVAVGRVTEAGSGTRSWVVKVNANGTLRWQVPTVGATPTPMTSEAEALGVARGIGGAQVAVLEAFDDDRTDATGARLRLRRFRTDGTVAGAREYALPALPFGNRWNVHSLSREVTEFVRLADGGYAVGGRTVPSGDNGLQPWVLRTDAAGVEQWRRTYPPAVPGRPSPESVATADVVGLAPTADGDLVFLSGATVELTVNDGRAVTRPWLVEVDAETGDIERQKVYRRDVTGNVRPDGLNLPIRPVGLHRWTDGGYLLRDTTGDLLKTNATGAVEWRHDASVYATRELFLVTAGSGVLTFDGGFVPGFVELSSTLCRDADGDGSTDDDGDALCDNWEIDGLDVDRDGTVDLDLPAMGADPERKDLFVEVDYMVDPAGTPYRPRGASTRLVVQAFENAPIENPDGSTGIDLHVTVDEQVPYVASLPVLTAPSSTAPSFDTIKLGTAGDPCVTASPDGGPFVSPHFGTRANRTSENCEAIGDARGLVFRYGLFVEDFPEDGPGNYASGYGELGGNDFVVALHHPTFVPGVRTAATRYGTTTRSEWTDLEAGTFMHELGHTLGLRHGGDDDDNLKPNYLSVMNYNYQFNEAGPGVGVPTGPGGVHPRTNRPVDYSRSVLPAVNESAFDERIGFDGPTGRRVLTGDDFSDPVIAPADGPVSLDGRPANESAVRVDLDRDGTVEETPLSGHDDWTALDFDFRDSPDFLPGSRTLPDGLLEQSSADYVEGVLGPTDADDDGIPNRIDVCPLTANAAQTDTDGDGVGDACPELADPLPTGSSLSRFDTDLSGRIEPIEVLDAIVAYNSGTPVAGTPVSVVDVLDVVVAYNAQTAV